MRTFPIVRNENIVVQNAGNETLIYDLVSNKAFCLNSTLTKVYLACDGKTTFEEFKSRHHFTDDLVFLSLDELKRENLIEIDAQYQSPLAKLTRREIAKRVGFSTLIALPLISSVIAPRAIEAASVAVPPGPCAGPNQSCPFDGTFTQGTCCDGLRCLDINACQTCRASGTFIYDFSSNLFPCTDAQCNTDARRNWCCNGILTAVFNGINVCNCRCQ